MPARCAGGCNRPVLVSWRLGRCPITRPPPASTPMAVDILVDLKGYTQHARTAILTYRPAPIQAQFLGYPGTMGTRLVDYLIADRFVVPDAHFRDYDEHIVHLPDCYQPNDPQRVIGPTPTRTDAGLPETGYGLLLVQRDLQDHARDVRHLDAAVAVGARERPVAARVQPMGAGQPSTGSPGPRRRSGTVDLCSQTVHMPRILAGSRWPIWCWTPCRSTLTPRPAMPCGPVSPC